VRRLELGQRVQGLARHEAGVIFLGLGMLALGDLDLGRNLVLVEVGQAERPLGENRNAGGLDLGKSALHEDACPRAANHHIEHAGAQARDEGRVARKHGHVALRAGQHGQFGVAR
jgi:hypothetical protein